MNKSASLQSFRDNHPEKLLRIGATEWRYRMIGAGPHAFLALPGGELVNDLGFEFALALKDRCRLLYPAWPRVSSIVELTGGLRALLDAEAIDRPTVLGASFGGSVAQIFVRRHPDRTRALILSNTGVPMRHLAPAVGLFELLARALPWTVTTRLLRKPLLRTVDPTGRDQAFWTAYLDELFSLRIGKADVLSNFRHQHEYHRRFRFEPGDLKAWPGRILLVESDNDIIGPARRRALRETYPGAQVHTFHDAGHAPLFTRFEEYFGNDPEFR